MRERRAKRLSTQLTWFVLLWAAGVAAVALVGYVLRLAIGH